MKEKGTLGVLIAGLLPVPAFVADCVGSLMPSMKFWPYLWTAVTILLCYVVTSLVFMGLYKGTWQRLVLGDAAVASFRGGTYALKRGHLYR